MLLIAGNQCLAGLPVLPAPQVYRVGNSNMVYHSKLNFISSSLEPQALARLKERWEEFTPEFSPDKESGAMFCKLILMGQDAAEDAKLKKSLTIHPQQIGEEGYWLVMNDSTRLIAAHTETGLFYGLQTLRQLTRAGFSSSLEIADWPAFRYRVVMDDISRGPISTVDHIRYQIRRLAEIKVNYLTFYIEHVIKTVSHPDFAPANGHLSIADIKELSAFASKYHIQLIGSFQSFGHFEKILSLPAYRKMGATANLIDPENPAAQQFLTDVIGEICDAFSAPWFNVNCDETFDLGKGSTQASVNKMGIAAYYAKHIRFLNGILEKQKKKMMLWGDIALQHEEILDMLPRDLVWLTWEYGDPATFDKWIQPFQKRGLPFMVCPGILNSNRLFPDHEMAVKNIAGFAKAGKERGAAGVFTTVWDDGGSAFFSSVWYSVYKAAEKSWNLAQATDSSFDSRYCKVAYGDDQSNYTKKLHAFLQLRKFPLTWNMTDQPWYQASLPDEGRWLLFSNAGTDSINAVLRSALALPAQTAKRNIQDEQALDIAMKQVQMTMQWRKGIARLSEGIRLFRERTDTGRARFLQELGTPEWLSQQAALAEVFRDRYTELWRFEDQAYWLQKALQPVADRMQAIEYLFQQHQLLEKIAAGTRPVPDSITSRLKVFETADRYFQNWLFCGPFEGIHHQPPAFLYSPDKNSISPKPGDQFSFQERSFRWKKFAAPTGGITYLEDQWPVGIAATEWVYAFASINSNSTRQQSAFLQAGEGAQVFCNGRPIVMRKNEKGLPFLVSADFQMQLPLIKGINYIVIKIPGGTPDKAFAFRLPPSVTLVNHKHKYYLDPNINDHEAE